MYTRGIRVVRRDVINLSLCSSVGRLKIYNNNNICCNKSENWKVVPENLAKVCSRRTTYGVYHVSKSPRAPVQNHSGVEELKQLISAFGWKH